MIKAFASFLSSLDNAFVAGFGNIFSFKFEKLNIDILMLDFAFKG